MDNNGDLVRLGCFINFEAESGRNYPSSLGRLGPLGTSLNTMTPHLPLTSFHNGEDPAIALKLIRSKCVD